MGKERVKTIIEELLDMDLGAALKENQANKIRQGMGRLVRVWRASYGMSLRALAKRSGYSAAYLSDVELGRRRVTTKLIHILAEDKTKS